MLTLRNLLESGIEIDGYKKIQCWEDEDNPTIYHEGYDFYGMDEKYLDRKVRYIFPYNTGTEVGITIELEEEDEE